MKHSFNKIITVLLLITFCAQTSYSVFDSKINTLRKQNLLQRKKQQQEASKKQQVFRSKTVKAEQEKRAKVQAASTVTRGAIRGMSNRIVIEKKDEKEEAYLLNALNQKLPVSITPAGAKSAPANAYYLGSFSDLGSKTIRFAYIAR